MVNHKHCKMRISKKNEVYLKLEDLQPSEQQELAEYFTFEVPGAKFMPMYRNRIWDGKIRLFSPASGEIYVGLLDYVKDYCDNNNISYILEENVDDTRDVVGSVVRGFVRSLKPKAKGKPSKLEIISWKLFNWPCLEIGLLFFLLLLLVNH